jgi:hypothetical protein
MSIIDELGEFDKINIQVSGRPHISDAGMRKINDTLIAAGYPPLPRGFPKIIESRMGKMASRVRAYMIAYHDTKLPAKMIESIGNLADRNIYHGKTVMFDITKNVLTWESGSFGNNNSCWRNSHASSINMFLEGTGYGSGFAIRVFRPDVAGMWYNNALMGYGRCWCMQIKDKSVLLFNPYGEKMAVFSALFTSLLPEGEYHTVNVSARNRDKGIYMNGEVATLVYSDDEADYWSKTLKDMGNSIVLTMPKYYTRECRKCRKKFGTRNGESMYCDNCGIPCFYTGDVLMRKNLALLTNVNVDIDGISYHVERGFLSSNIASRVMDYCDKCIKFHGNLDDCDE